MTENKTRWGLVARALAVLLLLLSAWTAKRFIDANAGAAFRAADEGRWHDVVDMVWWNRSLLTDYDAYGYNLLHCALRARRADAAVELLDLGADTNATTRQWPRSAVPPLVLALEMPPATGARADDVVVKALLDHGADPLALAPRWFRSKDPVPTPMLYWAVRFGRPAAARMLLARGADPNAVTPDGPLICTAVNTRDADMAELLLKSGAKEPPAEGATSPHPSLIGGE